MSAVPVENFHQGTSAANVVPVYMEHRKQSCYPQIRVHNINYSAAHVASQQNQRVSLESGQSIRMAELMIGDRVKTGIYYIPERHLLKIFTQSKWNM